MGLFSFLSKRPANKARSGVSSAASQRYEPSISGSVATTQGGRSVIGNETQVNDKVFRGTGFSQSALSLDSSDEDQDEEPAPTPRVPRFRDESVERPSTAPSSRPSSAAGGKTASPQTKKNGQKRPPPLSFRPTRPAPTAPSAPESRPSSRGSMRTITSALRRPAGHGRSESLRADSTAKTFKDLLDAQSEIKPADFHARVKAAGARDYGEDVAERNMGANGSFNFDLPHGQGYSSQPQTQGAGAEARAAGPAAAKKLDPYKAGVRRKSPPATQQTFMRPVDLESATPLGPGATRKQDPARRRSVSTYLPPGLGKMKFLPFDRSSEEEETKETKDLSPRTPGLDINKLDTGVAALGQSRPVIPRMPRVPRIPESAPAPAIRKAWRPRDSVELAKKRSETPVLEEHSENESSSSPATDFAVWSATRSRRTSAMFQASMAPKRHQSLQALRAPVSSVSALASASTSAVVTQDAVMQATPLMHPPIIPRNHGHREIRDGPIYEVRSVEEAASIKSIKSITGSPGRSARATSPTPSFRLLSMKDLAHPSAADITLPDDDTLDFPPPIRTRSTRGYSASSGTPTACGSSTSSASASITASTLNHTISTSNRPPSLHTAGTSVDLSIGTISPKLKPVGVARSLGNPHDDSEDDSGSNYDDRDEVSVDDDDNDHLARPKSSGSAVGAFNIDDYLSSDAESLTAAMAGLDDDDRNRDRSNSHDSGLSTATTTNTTPNRRPTAEGEEELLFDDFGFGMSGMQLPGLADSFPVGNGRAGKGSRRRGEIGVESESKSRKASQTITRRATVSMVYEDGMYDDVAAVRGRRRQWETDAAAVVPNVQNGRARGNSASARRSGYPYPSHGNHNHGYKRRSLTIGLGGGLEREREREREQNPYTTRNRRYILDTAADDDDDEDNVDDDEINDDATEYESARSEYDDDPHSPLPVPGNARHRKGLSAVGGCVGAGVGANVGAGTVDDEAGYDADYVEDDSEGLLARRRRQYRQRLLQTQTSTASSNQGKKTTTTTTTTTSNNQLSALRQLEGRGIDLEVLERELQALGLSLAHVQAARGQMEDEEEKPKRSGGEVDGEEPAQRNAEENKVAAAVRLRKEMKRAKRLAGQPSKGMLRRGVV
ncbi:hypothetical protein B0J18DRAFT_418636 [Chaetomium sp. MPI-SDFR-AT-0129]|nr:hypothetical protein B0J18DRAFT_418636 [Chaetomium sp. MPI-SDFR-AT-0129]